MNMANNIREKLQSALDPAHLEVINESHMHSVPANSETHFKLVIVSDKFAGESLIKRHRAVNTLLSEELANGVHALGLHTMTTDEWAQKNGSVLDSPECRGGAK